MLGLLNPGMPDVMIRVVCIEFCVFWSCFALYALKKLNILNLRENGANLAHSLIIIVKIFKCCARKEDALIKCQYSSFIEGSEKLILSEILSLYRISPLPLQIHWYSLNHLLQSFNHKIDAVLTEV